MRKRLFISILALILISCNSATPTPTNTPTLQPSPTATSTPTPQPSPTVTNTLTPTPVPLSEIKIESIVIEEGDLPAGFSGAQIRDSAPGMFRDLPSAQNTLYQQLQKDGDVAGFITIFLYDSKEDIENAYDLTVSGMTDEAELSSEVGEKATVLFIPSIRAVGTDIAAVAFVRCSAFVYINMSTRSEDSVIAYAKRLDGRLERLVCR